MKRQSSAKYRNAGLSRFNLGMLAPEERERDKEIERDQANKTKKHSYKLRHQNDIRITVSNPGEDRPVQPVKESYGDQTKDEDGGMGR